jgi:hypothetical protein
MSTKLKRSYVLIGKQLNLNPMLVSVSFLQCQVALFFTNKMHLHIYKIHLL